MTVDFAHSLAFMAMEVPPLEDEGRPKPVCGGDGCGSLSSVLQWGVVWPSTWGVLHVVFSVTAAGLGMVGRVSPGSCDPAMQRRDPRHGDPTFPGGTGAFRWAERVGSYLEEKE